MHVHAYKLLQVGGVDGRVTLEALLLTTVSNTLGTTARMERKQTTVETLVFTLNTSTPDTVLISLETRAAFPSVRSLLADSVMRDLLHTA